MKAVAISALIVGMFLGMVIGVVTATNNSHIQHRMAIEWANSISNPDNAEYVEEVAFNEGCAATQVTQEMFNERYVNQ